MNEWHDEPTFPLLLGKHVTLLSSAASNGRKYQLHFQESSGTLTIYPIYPGVEFILGEYCGQFCRLEPLPTAKFLQINFCLDGQLSWEPARVGCACLGTGDLSVHMLDRSPFDLYFPTKFYRGITILMEPELFGRHMPQPLAQSGFRPKALADKFCSLPDPYILSAPDRLRAFFSLAEDIPGQQLSAYFQLKLQELLLFLFCLDGDGSHLPEEPLDKNIRMIREIQKLLTSNLRERHTIEALSRDFLMNTSTLKKTFKEVYGQPIAQYMKDYRMHYAANLLCQTRLTVREIAESVGYGSQSKFANAFKEVMELSPMEYRLRCQTAIKNTK